MGDRIAQTLFLPYVVKFWTQTSENCLLFAGLNLVFWPSSRYSGNYKFNKWVMAERYGGDKLLGNSANHRVTM